MFLVETAAIVVILAIIALQGVSIAEKNDFAYLEQETTVPLRGLLAILIVLHHGSGGYLSLSFMSPFRFIGYLVVAVFFFLSGYGLRSGLNSNPSYMSGFLKKRLLKILIPYWIAGLVFFVINTGLLGAGYSVRDCILSMFLIKVLDPPCWYLQELLIFYLIFYISYKEKRRDWLFCLLFFTMFLIMLLAKVDDLYYESALTFPLGIIWREKKCDIDKIIASHYKAGLLILIVLLPSFFILKYVGNHLNIQFLFEMGNCVSALVFCALVLWCLKAIRLNNKLLAFLGGISYEVFLLHYCALRIAWGLGLGKHPLIMFGLTFVIVIPGSVLLNLITRKIWSRMG